MRESQWQQSKGVDPPTAVQALASGRRLLAVETWNEFSEGTEIQSTVETGRQYIELTRKYMDLFKVES